ncbi:MAG: hypothetical protein E6G64_09300 [Actinobacteria bacterium]|nr:MAG: hypothetical protein E6G64_09300 [Actinomycetota bacterium]
MRSPCCAVTPASPPVRRSDRTSSRSTRRSAVTSWSGRSATSAPGRRSLPERTNIGAGSITANYPHEPGRPKGKTTIGRNVRTGIQNGFQAPVEIGDDAWIAGGSYITDDVPPESLAGFPPRQVTKKGYLRRKRDNN